MSRGPNTRLTRRLILETPERQQDGSGGFVTTWHALGTLWAEVAPLTGREQAGAAGTLSRVPLRITVRAAPVGSGARPVAGQRLREGLRVYDVLAVTEADPRGRFLTVTAKEEIAA